MKKRRDRGAERKDVESAREKKNEEEMKFYRKRCRNIKKNPGGRKKDRTNRRGGGVGKT